MSEVIKNINRYAKKSKNIHYSTDTMKDIDINGRN